MSHILNKKFTFKELFNDGGDINITKEGKDKLKVCRTMSTGELKDVSKKLDRVVEELKK